MLQIGNVGLTLTEQYTHMTMWCIAGAPLLAGTDLIHASNETLAILANREVTAIDQDLGKGGAIQGKLLTANLWADQASLAKPGGASKTEVWAKHLADGKSVAVALLNLGDNATSISASWELLGLPSATTSATVRDLWAKKDLGTVSGMVRVAAVPSHGTAFLKLAWK
jgi:alpha-galactosidase